MKLLFIILVHSNQRFIIELNGMTLSYNHIHFDDTFCIVFEYFLEVYYVFVNYYCIRLLEQYKTFIVILISKIDISKSICSKLFCIHIRFETVKLNDYSNYGVYQHNKKIFSQCWISFQNVGKIKPSLS